MLSFRKNHLNHGTRRLPLGFPPKSDWHTQHPHQGNKHNGATCCLSPAVSEIIFYRWLTNKCYRTAEQNPTRPVSPLTWSALTMAKTFPYLSHLRFKKKKKKTVSALMLEFVFFANIILFYPWEFDRILWFLAPTNAGFLSIPLISM